MFAFFKKKTRSKPRSYRATLEILEDRAVPATITLVGAGRFGDGGLASLINTGGNNYTAINLRSAIVGANNLVGPDTIVLENGTYTMSAGSFLVSDPSGTLTIANGQGGTSTINAQKLSRIFLNQTGLALSGLKLTNGLDLDAGGAIYNNGTLNINNCQFVNNEVTGTSAGESVQGGAIYNNVDQVLNVQNSTFSGNIAKGGISSIYLGGTAPAAGGAIYYAGGIAVLTDNILSSTFVGNEALGGDGAVLAGYGARGGVGAGGGIFAQAGSYNLNVIDATFAYNVAQGGHGALADGGNAAGGGLYFQNGGLGTTRLVNDTIALNQAFGGQGSGALAAQGIGSGGGLADSLFGLPVPKVINTIVAKNLANIHVDVDGAFASLGSNLIGNNTGAAASFNTAAGDFVGNAQKALDPGLDSLGNYGGPTQTFRPSAGSFVIDRGNDTVVTTLKLTTDQRGDPRRAGSAVDIGSYEIIQAGQNRTYTMGQGSTLVTTAANGLLAGWGNPLGKTVTVQLVPGKGPANGQLTLKSNGTFTYVPAKSFNGTVTFSFEILMNGQITDIFTVTINVTKTSGRLTF